jgi:hypothetical protein
MTGVSGLQIDDAFPPMGVSAPMQGCTDWGTNVRQILTSEATFEVQKMSGVAAPLVGILEILPD